MEQLSLALKTIMEVGRVKQEVQEKLVEYKTGMISSSYAGILEFMKLEMNKRSYISHSLKY